MRRNPTSRRRTFFLRLGAVAGIVVLATFSACSPPMRVTAPDRAEVRVGAHAVTVAAPPGYCVDPESLRVVRDGIMLLLAQCSPRSGHTGANAAMTVHLSESPLFVPQEGHRETLERLGKFLQGETGRQVLSRDGSAKDVKAGRADIKGDALFIHVTDRGGPRLPGASPTYWRGFTEVSGVLASLTVYGLGKNPLRRDSGLALARALADSLHRANTPG